MLKTTRFFARGETSGRAHCRVALGYKKDALFQVIATKIEKISGQAGGCACARCGGGLTWTVNPDTIVVAETCPLLQTKEQSHDN